MASTNAGVAPGPEREGNVYATVIPRVERQNVTEPSPEMGPSMIAIPDEAQLSASPGSPKEIREQLPSSGLSASYLKALPTSPPSSIKGDNSLLLRPLPTPPETTKFLPISCAMELWEVADPTKVTLPQLFRIEDNYNCGAISLDEGEIVMVLHKKTVTTVRGADNKGRKLVFFQNSTNTMSPIADESQQSKLLTPQKLASLRHLPPAVKALGPFTDSKGNEVPAGSLLFFKTSPNIIKSISRKVRKSAVKAKDHNGRSILIAPDSSTTFSSHPDDVKLYLAEVVHHCQLPVKVLPEDGQYSKEVITLEEAHLQEVLVAQRYSRVNNSSHFELATNEKLPVTKVALADKRLEENIYSVAYESVCMRPLPQPTSAARGSTYPTTHTEPEDADDTTGSDYATVMDWRQPTQEGSHVSPKVPATLSNVYSEVLIAPKPQHPNTSRSSPSASQLPQTSVHSPPLLLDVQETASERHLPSQLPQTFVQSPPLLIDIQDTDGERHSPSQLPQTSIPSPPLLHDIQDTAGQRHSPLQPTISHDQNMTMSLSPPSQQPLGMQGAASAMTVTGSDEEKMRKENLSQLRKLGVGDILHLLEEMHLAEYRPAFEREFIDGQILSSLTDGMLLQDLQVSTELHRLRLMKVIKGEKSVRAFLHKT